MNTHAVGTARKLIRELTHEFPNKFRIDGNAR